jgi:hypothetical protein
VSECKLRDRKYLPRVQPDLNGLTWPTIAPNCTGLDSRVKSQGTSQNFFRPSLSLSPAGRLFSRWSHLPGTGD